MDLLGLQIIILGFIVKWSNSTGGNSGLEADIVLSHILHATLGIKMKCKINVKFRILHGCLRLPGIRESENLNQCIFWGKQEGLIRLNLFGLSPLTLLLLERHLCQKARITRS